MASPTTNAWVNPPPSLAQPTQAIRSKFLWVVGEQQNLSWVTAATSSVNISLSQATENGNVITTDPILIDYGSKSGSNFRAWVVQVPLFDLSDSNTFFFTLNVKSDAHAWPLLSVYFNITDQSDSGSSSAMPTLTLGSSHSTAISASVPTVTSLTQSTVGSVLWGTETVSTVRTATSSSSPSSAPLNGISRETLGIALGIGIPVLMALLGTLFVLLKNIKLLKRKTLPDENLSQCTSKHVRSCQQIFEVAGDFTYRDEPSGDRNPSHFAELPA